MILIGFSTVPQNPFSRLIRAMTGSRVSHAWLLDTEGFHGVEVVIEATDVGFRLIPFDVFKKQNEVVATFTPPLSLEPGVRVAARWLGERYDFAGLFATSVVLLGRWLKRRWRNPVHSSDALFCSEAVVRVLQASGYPEADKLVPEDTTPEDLLEFLESKKLPPD